MKQRMQLKDRVILLLILLLSLFIRIYFYWDKIIIDGVPYLTDTDVVFHLRRAEICIRHYPWMPMFNSYEEYPKGSYYESPPLHAFILASIAFIAGGFKYHSSEFTRWVLIFYPPIFSAIAIWLLHYLARLLFNNVWVAHLSALLAACFPISMQYSYLGNFDHHISDYLGILLYYLLLIRSIDKLPMNSSRELIKIAIMPGAALAFAFYVWQASFLHAAISSLTFFIYYFLHHRREIILFAAMHFYWCCFFLLPGDIYAAAYGVAWNSLAFFSFGQALIILALGSFFLAFYFALDVKTNKIINSLKLKTTWISLVIILGVLYVLKYDIREGVRILIHNPIPWLRSVTESTPILFIYHRFSLEPLLSNFSYASILFPVFLFLFYKKVIKADKSFSKLLIANAGFIYFFLTNAQARFGYPFTIPLALITAFYLTNLPAIAIKKVINKRILNEGIISFILCLAMLLPCRVYYAKQELIKSYLILKEALDWIRNNTPKTSDFGRAQKKPEYSVLADWEYGTFIEYYAQRPTNIDARGPLYSDWSPVAKFLLSANEDEANLIREQLGIKYILIADWYASLRIYPEWMNANWLEYFTYIPSEDGESTVVAKEKLISTIGFQMSELAGGPIIASNRIIRPSLQHYRLAWESSQLLFGGRMEPTSSLKLLEYVRGVKLKCKGNPGDKIEIVALVITNISRSFQYRNFAYINSSGYTTLYLPYATGSKLSSVFVERYYINNGGKVIQLQNINEEMIEEGAELYISFD